MNRRFVSGALLLVASHAASAAWTFDGVSFAVGKDTAGHEYTSINLRGQSTDSCVPIYADGHIDHKLHTAEFKLSPHPDDSPCLSGDRSWEYALRLYSADAGGTYDVEVLVDGTRFAEFDVTIDQAQRMAAAKAAASPGLAPSEGMWWSSEKPGTGLAFNLDQQGRWFAALYLYDKDGEPTFLTLQGDSLAYDLEARALEPYAVGTSPVIRSTGGQCLDCPWTQATASDTELDAQILFWDRNRAKLTIGDWSLDLTLLPETPASSPRRAAPALERHYTLTLDSDTGRHVAVVRGIPGTGLVFTGQERVGLECVDCRTVDDGGAASDQTDDALSKLIAESQFLCTAGDCDITVDGTTARSYIDKTGQTITAIVADADAPEADALHIELRLLPEGWRK